MFAKRFFKSRLLCLYGASAIAAFSLGSTEWASDLFACTGQTCLGGCLSIIADGAYADENYCEEVSKNVFEQNQAVLLRDVNLVIPGPNVQPVKAPGMDNLTNDNPTVNLPCDTLILQVPSSFTSDPPRQVIPLTLCPPPT